MSSTHFEWTIDEVSKILPVNVEPDESQFQNSPNPEMEARAQKAISKFFKENKIVPSPFNGSVQNCAARSIYKPSANTPEVKPGRRIRDCASQTMLTIPAKIPADLEEMLKKYMLPELAEPESIDLPTHLACTTKRDYIKDTSLRRKLFDMQNIILLDSAPGTPISSQTDCDYETMSSLSPMKENHLQRKSKMKMNVMTPLRSSVDTKCAFGNLSPILNGNDTRSPLANINKSFKRLSGITEFFNGIEDQISPIRRE